MTGVTYFKLCGFILVPLCLAVFPTRVTAFLFKAVLALLAFIAIFVSLHIFSKCRSESHTLRTMLVNHLSIMFMWIFGWWARKRLERESKDCRKVQEKMLMEIINNNKDTVYGREFSFESIKSAKDFMETHPLTTKSHYKEYADRIAKGEDAVLTKERTIKLAVTSGTTGPGSMLPRVQSQENRFFIALAAFTNAMFNAYPKTFNLQRILSFYRQREEEITEGGIRKCPVTSDPPSGPQLSLFSTPSPGFHILDSDVSLYVHLLFGLKDRNIGTLFSILAESTLRGFLALEDNWQRLIKDIEEGRLDSDLELDFETRSELNSCLKPDKKRAEELRKEFQAGFDAVAPRIWPNLRILLCVTTGSQELYAKKLRERYTGQIPLYSPVYASTESPIGVNLWPRNEAVYLPVLSVAFFEFIPVDNFYEEQPKTYLAEDLEVDSLYELVVTTPAGLYRYRIGDVVKVARYHNNAPVLEFQYRKGQLFNFCHTTEKMMYNALVESVQSFGGKIQLEDYTSAENVLFNALPETGSQQSKGTFHVVFVELSGTLTAEETILLQEKIDVSLCNQNIVHRNQQSSGAESPTRLYRLKQGSFEKLREHLMERNPTTSPLQFKIPRVITTKEAGDLLLAKLHPQDT